jgi:hypothetical protein
MCKLIVAWHVVFPIQNVLSTPRPSLRSGLVLQLLSDGVLDAYKYTQVSVLSPLVRVCLQTPNRCIICVKHLKNFLAVSCKLYAVSP